MKREQVARSLFLVFCGLALLVPILTAVLNNGGDRVGIEAGPDYMYAVSGPFTWRFFQWQIFGHNDLITGFGMTLHDMLGIRPSDATTFVGFINILNPTLFHVSLLFLVAALIARKRGAVVSKNQPPQS
jgi:hypothetical protein